MSEIATQELGISLQKLREMVATSETFQEGVQGGYADALERVYIGRQPGEFDRPFAVLSSSRFGASLDSGGSMNHLRLDGDLDILIEVDADEELETDSEKHIAAGEFVGGVIADLNDLAALDNPIGEFDESHLPTLRFSLSSFRANEINFRGSEGHYFIARATLSWGDG